MGFIEKLFDSKQSNSEFLSNARRAFAEITGIPIDKNVAINLNRLFTMYGRKGVISALVTLDAAVMSKNFKLDKNNYYSFLVYGAKRAFEPTDTSSNSLEDVVKKINKRRKHG